MGKYSNMLSNRLRANRQVSNFHKIPAEQMLDISRCKNVNDVEYCEYYKTKEHWIMTDIM